MPRHASFATLDVAHDANELFRLAELHPLEQALVANAVARRKAEFADGRWCAHQALALQPGMANAKTALLKGERGMPLWPEGYCGAISHTAGFRAAVVAPTEHIASIGFDSEPRESLPADVFAMISRLAERQQVVQLQQHGIECADRLLFCAKEATYKVWFPLTKHWLGFEEAEIDIRADGSVYSYPLIKGSPVRRFEGRWYISEALITVVLAVPAPGKQLHWPRMLP
ncbi:MAG: 4'-phosphopantetheinyl transferase superfamily protein [Corynebacterium sp.]|nr:4'-phosphopantetheinyl transferase superfamily protein [Corynebacterium sp.]